MILSQFLYSFMGPVGHNIQWEIGETGRSVEKTKNLVSAIDTMFLKNCD